MPPPPRDRWVWEANGRLRLEGALEPRQLIDRLGEAVDEPLLSVGGKGWV